MSIIPPKNRYPAVGEGGDSAQQGDQSTANGPSCSSFYQATEKDTDSR
jgi:hypothetical protein